MNKHSLQKGMAYAMLATVMGTMLGRGYGLPEVRPMLKPRKKCLCCGKEHVHNNCFCSASCCKQYRQQQKENQGVAAKLRTTNATSGAPLGQEAH